jgi:transposase
VPRPAQAAVRALDPRGRAGVDRAALWHRPRPQHRRQLSAPLGLHPAAPIRRAIEQRPERIRAWLAEDYPRLAARAKAAGAEIHWGDETGISNQASYGRSFAPKGQTPVVRRPGRRSTTSMISSITNRGRLRFMVYEGALNARLFLAFLKRLIRGQERKIFLILDNLKVHHAKPVQAWVAAHQDRIELVFLPPYAPEHNPDELLNQNVKRRLAKGPPPRSRTALEYSLRRLLHRLQKLPAKVRACFQAPPPPTPPDHPICQGDQ